jgi:hypothetical protein
MSIELENPIILANERMTIHEACEHIGFSVGSISYSGKLYCPFGDLFHADGGSSKSFRIYPETNSAHCFAGCGYFNPVKLIGKDKGLSDLQAAEYILTFTKYVPPDIDSQWDAVTSIEETVDTSYLAEALKVYCLRIAPDWEIRQFDPSISTKLRQCLELTAQVHTAQQAKKWLAVTKKVMAHELGDSHVSTV